MKITVFNGSPAGKESATSVIATAFLSGAAEAGAQTNHIFLCEKNVQHCKGCFTCWFKNPGICVMQDAMQDLMHAYNTSDVVCFATPVYTWNYTAYLKNFVDRLAPLKSLVIAQQNAHFDLIDTKPKTQKFMVIANCGFPGTHNFDVMQASFACCNPFLEIYRNCGKLLKSKQPDIKQQVDTWLAAVRRAGFETVKDGDVSEAVRKALEMPLMEVQDYVQYLGMGQSAQY